MATKESRKKFIEEFSNNYSELFVSVFIMKYNKNFEQKHIIEDLEKCLSESRRKIVTKFADNIVYVKEEED